MMLDFLIKNLNSGSMKRIPSLISIFLLAISSLQGQETAPSQDAKALGDKVFTIDLGLDAPLFFQDMEGSMHTTNLSPGGVLGMSMEGYLNNNYRLGGGFKLNFSANPNGKFLFTLPFFFRNTWENRFYPFSLRGSLDAGLMVLSYTEQVKVDPFLSPSVALSYSVNPQWSAGLNLAYWWVPQIYWGREDLQAQNRFGNFAEVSLGFTYHWY